jgi:hypothetical protein
MVQLATVKFGPQPFFARSLAMPSDSNISKKTKFRFPKVIFQQTLLHIFARKAKDDATNGQATRFVVDVTLHQKKSTVGILCSSRMEKEIVDIHQSRSSEYRFAHLRRNSPGCIYR